MDAYVVDATAAIELVRAGFQAGEVQLIAPGCFRSQVLAQLRRAVVAGEVEGAEALDLAESACRLPRRVLGDAVLRRTAWRLAAEHGWSDMAHAEYVGLTRLHGRALVTDDPALAAGAEGIVPTLTAAALHAGKAV